MKKLFASVCLAGIFGMAILSAQGTPEVVIGWNIETWALGVVPGVGLPIQSQDFTRAGATCNLTPVIVDPKVAIQNPTRIQLTDPDLPLRACTLDSLTANGFLAALPLGTQMTATARAKGATLLSTRSAASNPFSRVVIVIAPPAPTGIAVIP